MFRIICYRRLYAAVITSIQHACKTLTWSWVQENNQSAWQSKEPLDVNWNSKTESYKQVMTFNYLEMETSSSKSINKEIKTQANKVRMS